MFDLNNSHPSFSFKSAWPGRNAVYPRSRAELRGRIRERKEAGTSHEPIECSRQPATSALKSFPIGSASRQSRQDNGKRSDDINQNHRLLSLWAGPSRQNSRHAGKLPLQTTRRHKPQLNCLKSQNPSLNENEAGGCYFPIVPIFPKTSSDQYKTVIFGLGKYIGTGEVRSLEVSRQRCPPR